MHPAAKNCFFRGESFIESSERILMFSHYDFTTRIRVGGIELPRLGQKMIEDNRG